MLGESQGGRRCYETAEVACDLACLHDFRRDAKSAADDRTRPLSSALLGEARTHSGSEKVLWGKGSGIEAR